MWVRCSFFPENLSCQKLATVFGGRSLRLLPTTRSRRCFSRLGDASSPFFASSASPPSCRNSAGPPGRAAVFAAPPRSAEPLGLLEPHANPPPLSLMLEENGSTLARVKLGSDAR